MLRKLLVICLLFSLGLSSVPRGWLHFDEHETEESNEAHACRAVMHPEQSCTHNLHFTIEKHECLLLKLILESTTTPTCFSVSSPEYPVSNTRVYNYTAFLNSQKSSLSLRGPPAT